MIFCANPYAQYFPYKEEIAVAIERVLNRGHYILGEEVSSFESEFAQYLGANFAVGCGSGTDALLLALKALDIGPGDEVIVPSHTAVPTVAAVVMAGATPVYVDVEPDFYTLNVAKVEAACNGRTKAVIAVHLYGQSADLKSLVSLTRARGIYLIEDCAQATGASWNGNMLGVTGDIGCFSFFPTKNLGAIGDGGALVCNDHTLAERLRRLRQYGWDEQRISQEPGVNSRLDELQAAILRVKLRYLNEENEARRALAHTYNDAFEGFDLVRPAERDQCVHVYHLYVVQVEERASFMASLASAGVHAGIHYPVPVHKMPAYQRGDVDLSISESVADRVVSLPLYPGMGDDALSQVIAAVHACFKHE